MTWFAAGAVAIGTVGTIASGASAARAGAREAGRASRAEGEAITKERINQTVRNSYSTALGQMQLALKKRQYAQQGHEISAARLVAKGDADANAAASGSIGASVNAVSEDINMKAQSALDMTTDQFENDVQNFNRDLDVTVLNTNESAPTVREVSYTGPSIGQLVGGAVLGGVLKFAGQYASRQMKLGLGTEGGGNSGSGLSLNSPSGVGLRFGTQRARP